MESSSSGTEGTSGGVVSDGGVMSSGGVGVEESVVGGRISTFV